MPVRQTSTGLDENKKSTESDSAGQAFTDRGVHVIIGKENKSETIQNYSVVISQYGLPGEAIVCIAVIGRPVCNSPQHRFRRLPCGSAYRV